MLRILLCFTISFIFFDHTVCSAELNKKDREIVDFIVKYKEHIKTQSAVDPLKLVNAFALGSNFTDLQRDQLKKESIGMLVNWNISIYEIQKNGDCFDVITNTGTSCSIVTKLCPANDEDRRFIYGLRTGSVIEVSGMIEDIPFRQLVISPAILTRSLKTFENLYAKEIADIEQERTDEYGAVLVARYERVEKERLLAEGSPNKELKVTLKGVVGLDGLVVYDGVECRVEYSGNNRDIFLKISKEYKGGQATLWGKLVDKSDLSLNQCTIEASGFTRN